MKDVNVNLDINNTRDIDVLEQLKEFHIPLASLLGLACVLYINFLRVVRKNCPEKYHELLEYYHKRYSRPYPVLDTNKRYQRICVSLSRFSDAGENLCFLGRNIVYDDEYPYSQKEFVIHAAWFVISLFRMFCSGNGAAEPDNGYGMDYKKMAEEIVKETE